MYRVDFTPQPEPVELPSLDQTRLARFYARVTDPDVTLEDIVSTDLERPCICADCGNEQDSMVRNCGKCLSTRVVLKSVIEEILGKDWREQYAQNTLLPPDDNK